MIYCLDEQRQPMTDASAMKIIRRAVFKVRPYFPQESFSFEDILQETLIRILPHLPFSHPAVLYVASKRKAIEYHRVVAGRNENQWKERGGRRMQHREAITHGQAWKPGMESQMEIALSREPEPSQLPEIRDEIEWAMSRLNERDKKIVLAYASDDYGEGSIEALAEELGITPSAIYVRMKKIQETMNNERNSRPQKSTDDWASCQAVIRSPPDRLETDRQRAVKRLANTR